jgi:hypothetical protein
MINYFLQAVVNIAHMAGFSSGGGMNEHSGWQSFSACNHQG